MVHAFDAKLYSIISHRSLMIWWVTPEQIGLSYEAYPNLHKSQENTLPERKKSIEIGLVGQFWKCVKNCPTRPIFNWFPFQQRIFLWFICYAWFGYLFLCNPSYHQYDLLDILSQGAWFSMPTIEIKKSHWFLPKLRPYIMRK